MCHSQKTDKMANSRLTELTWGVGMAEENKKAQTASAICAFYY